LEVGDLSTQQENKKLEQDALFTRFVELFKDFFYKSPVMLQCLDLDLPKLQKIFHHSWDKKAPPEQERIDEGCSPATRSNVLSGSI